LIKLFNDLLLAANVGLCLLDFTSAFDTVHHQLLLLQLERQFGLRGIALAWFWCICLAEHFMSCSGPCVVHSLHCLLSPAGLSAGSCCVQKCTRPKLMLKH